VEDGTVEVDLVQAKVADFGSTQAVPVGQQDHDGIAVTVAVAPGRPDQRLDLIGGEVLPGPKLGVLRPLREETVRFTSVGATTRR
jgi:hypothetical protein